MLHPPDAVRARASIAVVAPPRASQHRVAEARTPNGRRGVLALVETRLELLADAEHELWWRADHTDGERLVRGGWSTVRMLLGSVDGNQWPWTGITLDTESATRWAQVLGTPQKLTLEIGSGNDFWRLGHAHQPPGHPIEMPPGCQWWVTWVWSHQIFTADEAYGVTRQYLTTGLVDAGSWSMEELHETRHRQRPRAI